MDIRAGYKYIGPLPFHSWFQLTDIFTPDDIEEIVSGQSQTILETEEPFVATTLPTNANNNVSKTKEFKPKRVSRVQNFRFP